MRNHISLRKSFRGFTLVELLVVVAILAVLISILIPAITGVHRRALITQCSANMHSMVGAIVQYSTENKGKLLPVSGGYSMATNGGTPGVGPLFSRTHFLLDNGGLPGGMMTTAAFVKIRNCPATYDATLPSYAYNVHPAVAGTVTNPIPTTWQNVAPRWTSITSHPKDRILMMDTVRDIGSANHGHSKTGVWNVAFTDGSVRAIANDDLYAQIKLRPITGGTGAAATMSWRRFNDYVRVLELLSAGRNPKLAAGNTKYFWDNPANGTNQPDQYYNHNWPGESIGPLEN